MAVETYVSKREVARQRMQGMARLLVQAFESITRQPADREDETRTVS